MTNVETHSIIITLRDKLAVVWYPDAPYAHWHRTDSEGHIDPEPFRIDHSNPIGAVQFIEHYATGTEG